MATNGEKEELIQKIYALDTTFSEEELQEDDVVCLREYLNYLQEKERTGKDEKPMGIPFN